MAACINPAIVHRLFMATVLSSFSQQYLCMRFYKLLRVELLSTFPCGAVLQLVEDYTYDKTSFLTSAKATENN
ncbi:MAG: hypothetical protein JAY75_16460, partial [Candidatus Thiodiazotropha taylori]|nr:hypothetical protein [Candidatus Thiodiazotropha taylori]MCW4309808.1 hypothetical protein [Candidatus Thiodiazotropha endolucinida]